MAKAESDRILVATVQFNVSEPGKCDACGRQTQKRRAVKVGYVNDLPVEERDRRVRAGETEQEIVDQFFQQLAAQQLRGDLGRETRDTLCGACAGKLIDIHMASGQVKAPLAEGAGLLQRASATGEPIFVGLCIDVERGPQGRMTPTVAVRVDAAVDPATVLRGAPPLRAGDAPVRVRPALTAPSAPNTGRGVKKSVKRREKRGERRQPDVNRPVPGQVSRAYSALFPEEWRDLGEKLRKFDTAWFLAHPNVDEFAREYVPGEAYPKHDPDVRYVTVKRMGNNRVRGMLTTRPTDLPFVELPDELRQSEEE